MLRRFVLALVPATVLSAGVAGSSANAVAAETPPSAGPAAQSAAYRWQPRFRFQRPQFRRPQFRRPGGGVPFNPYVFMPRPRPFIPPKFDETRFAPKKYVPPPAQYDQYGRRWNGRPGYRTLDPRDNFRNAGPEPPTFYPWNQPGYRSRR